MEVEEVGEVVVEEVVVVVAEMGKDRSRILSLQKSLLGRQHLCSSS